MYAIVKYTDNTMQNYNVIETSENLHDLDMQLQSIRIAFYGEKEKPIFRIIKL